MTDGIEGLFDVGELLNRLAKQKTLIEEQAKLLDGYQEVVEKLIRAHDEREASDKRVDALWEEMIEMTSDLAEHNRRVGQAASRQLYLHQTPKQHARSGV